MNEKLDIEVIIPYSYFPYRADYSLENFNITLNEIEDIFNNEVFDFGDLLPKSKLVFKNILNFYYSTHYKYLLIKDWGASNYCFVISLKTELNVKHYHDSSNFTDAERKRYKSSLLKIFISDYFIAIIYELVLSANIARPGCFSVYKGAVFINDQKIEDTYSFSGVLGDAYDTLLKIRYPQICFLEIGIIRKWIKDNNINFLDSEKPANKLSTAIYCLTYVCSDDLSSAENLIYCMIALEALYTKSHDNITEQLNSKIQIYLGEINDYKKIIKNMYAIRSRFLHGDMPIKPIFLYGNTVTESDYEDEIYDALLISTRILIRTIQKMIIENRTELDFEYKLK